MRFMLLIVLSLTSMLLGGQAFGEGVKVEAGSADAAVLAAAATARAEARWAALIRGDFDSAYAFEAPGYRKSVSLDTFKSKFGRAAVWKDAKVSVATLSPDASSAKVRVSVTYEPRPPMGGDFPPVTRPLTESWIYKDGQWWHVSD